ncbi:MULTISPECIES: acyl carrier protein [Arthrobacter]|uniref:Carrier domain-containing protein n=1 Tax=Arthrobacter terricola TaxID=2547396 RepID=A0A4R5K9U2_9MICC|nr:MULTISPECIES: acyl carrier protein [Arthrobacter]MBT8163495.1 acyl carrier protein [Arthrobacter sp. GN70]TDF89460.1 hypothetical protein E1809_22905 [Arthrobacter terricola]
MATTTDRIADLVESVSSGEINKIEALDHSRSLSDKGLTSLAFLQLVDAIETDLGVYIDLEGDISFLQTVEGIASYVDQQTSS